MLPIGDDSVEGGPPAVVTFALIALNVLAFFVELGQPSEAALQSFIQAWGVVPREYSTFQDLPPAIPLPFWSTLLTSMFLHGGWMHLGGNMLYLWIFGDNVEDRFGHAKFLLFYLLCGIAATFAQVLVSAGSNVPNLGASGAIAGVLASYLILFPRGQVKVLMGRGVVPMPALVVIGLWIVLQFINGIGSITQSAETGGVAYMAHIGGFVAGLVLTFLFGGRRTAVTA